VLNEQCSAIKGDTQRCNARAITGSTYCWNHAPEYAEARRRNARKGGHQGGKGRPNPGTADLVRLQRAFEDLAERVLAGAVDRGDAAVAIQSWNGARACIAASARLRELEEVERRLAALEQAPGA
jgi:hypothetical protein